MCLCWDTPAGSSLPLNLMATQPVSGIWMTLQQLAEVCRNNSGPVHKQRTVAQTKTGDTMIILHIDDLLGRPTENALQTDSEKSTI